MKASYVIDSEARIIFSQWSGVVTQDETVAEMKRLLADKNFSPFYDRLYDVREVTQVQMTKDGLMAIAVLDPIYPSERRAVVTSNPAVFGMGRMFGLLTGKEEQGNYRVFSDYQQALNWLQEPHGQKKSHDTLAKTAR